MSWVKYTGQTLKVNDIVALKSGGMALATITTIKGDIADSLEGLHPNRWSYDWTVDRILNKRSGLQKSGWFYNIYGEKIDKITHVFTIPELKK